MAKFTLTEQNIIDAIAYIDKNGVPDRNQSTKYELIINEKQYPPKYVIAVGRHLADGSEINTVGFDAVEAKNFFKARGYVIAEKQEKYELVITANGITSTSEEFTMGNLALGDSYKPLDAYFERKSGDIIRRERGKSENKISNMTLPRLTCQIFEKQLMELSDWDRKEFPICRYRDDSEIIKGIFSTKDEFKKYRNTIEYMTYTRDGGPQFVIYCWNIFSTLVFVQECLKRFGEDGDKFILSYREKNASETMQKEAEEAQNKELEKQAAGCMNEYSNKLLQSKNIIFRGAPGTGKTYLAKSIAADIISNGYFDSYESLSEEQKEQVGFVQFHPSFDYTDFVEGLRPTLDENGTMRFEVKQGIFKEFVMKAIRNYESSLKTTEELQKELSANEALDVFFAQIDFSSNTFKTVTGNEFSIIDIDDNHIYLSIPGNNSVNKLTLNIDEIRKMLESGKKFEKVTDLTAFFGKKYATQQFSYDFALYNIIKDIRTNNKNMVAPESLKKYVFIIDEINRGEISKILGELFFSIDPGYRGPKGEVSTQYSNMHPDGEGKFYIPENVYIIGTMNDIDRSVDSFDFAMRRRFRFIEIRADENLSMLDTLENEDLKNEAINRMEALNQEILTVEDLNENYQIGASYFLKLKSMSFDELWTDCLAPLLQDYIRGMYDEKNIMKRFEKAYGYKNADEGSLNEAN